MSLNAAIGEVPVVSNESSFGPAADESTSAVPAAARARLKDRLRKREVKRALAELPDGEQILVIGLRSGQMDEIRGMNDEDEETGDSPSVTKTQGRMFRAMCYDPVDESPVFEDWTDEEFAQFPLADATVIMKAIGIVNGAGTEPGKGSPSTAAADSSLQ